MKAFDHISFGNVTVLPVEPVDLSILTNIVLAADSVLYSTHSFVKIEEILYLHFQSFSLFTKKKKHCNVV